MTAPKPGQQGPQSPSSRARPRLALVTGASGFVGGALVGRLLEEGWRVRVLTRRRHGLERAAWADRLVAEGAAAGRGEVEPVEGDAASREDLARALEGVEVAWYLLHSMGDVDDFERAEREMAAGFAAEAAAAASAPASAACLRRIVYLGGLHPESGELSAHLRSRAEVGRILMASGVPTAALQAGVILGEGSASFAMLQGLVERLPGAFGPRWLRNRITPIAMPDLLHFLVRAADLPADVSRTFDVGGPETMPYADMLPRAARALGLGPRPVLTIPVMTPRMASRWIAMVTSVPHGLVTPIVESVLHDTVVRERDLEALVGLPEGGLTRFEDAVVSASDGHDPKRAGRIVASSAAAVLATMLIGSLATNPRSAWYASIRKPSWQPPGVAFPLVWTALYADIAWMTALARMDLAEAADREAANREDANREDAGARHAARAFRRAFAGNLVLNAGWSLVFFRGHRLLAAAGVAAALALSSADLVRRVGATSRERGVVLAPYAAWTAFATVLSGAIAWLNRRR